jgi:peptidoglycan/xylan/chitin deacetylase (PgdA/CDA1 family)
MDSGLTRIICLLAMPLALCAGIAVANAGECPGHPDAIGTSRTIVVDPREHGRIGTMDYAETLPLADHEVVLTFDDGPIPPYTSRILDILAAECVHATYFIVGEMAKEYPALVRRAHDEGHTIGTHSMNHPMRFRALSVERGNAQIDNGITATAAALGDPDKLAPFFRFPGFGHTQAAHEHATELGLMVWGADVPADDWHKLGPNEVARRAVQRLENKGKGILLLHDIHQRTVEALPIILSELKARGFRIVHVVPASAERPATVTAASAWLPHSRPALAAPVILIAEVLEHESEGLAKKTDAELCSLLPAEAETVGRASRRHQRMAQIAHAELAPHRHGHGHGRLALARTKPAKVAHATPTEAASDLHAVQ